ncbi:hypothetical protein FIBSPDRAFT_867246, partial [Athelia psychrophila]
MSDKLLGLRCAPQAPCCEEGFIFMDVDSKEDKEAQLMGYDIGLLKHLRRSCLRLRPYIRILPAAELGGLGH